MKKNGKVKKITKRYVRIIACVSDFHFGNEMAMLPPNISLKEGGVLPRNEAQKRIYEYYEDFLKQCNDIGVTDVIVAGDIIDGNNKHCNGQNCATTDLNIQRQIAIKVLAPLVKNRNSLFIHGTDYHDKDIEEGICNQLGGTWGGFWDHIAIKVGNLIRRIEVQHRAPFNERMDILYGLAGSAKHANVSKKDIYVRGHWHTGEVTDEGGIFYVKLPCWTAIPRNEFTAKNKNKYQYSLDIGGVFIFIDDKGGIEVKLVVRDRNGFRYEVPTK